MKLIFQNAKKICIAALVSTAVSIAKAEQPNDENSETASASTVETEIKVDRAPLPVQHTIKQHAGNAAVDLFKQFENGRFVDEARFKKNGLLNELKIAQDGIILLRREPRTPMVVLNPGKDETELLLQNTPALVEETFREQSGTIVLSASSGGGKKTISFTGRRLFEKESRFKSPSLRTAR